MTEAKQPTACPKCGLPMKSHCRRFICRWLRCSKCPVTVGQTGVILDSQHRPIGRMDR